MPTTSSTLPKALDQQRFNGSKHDIRQMNTCWPARVSRLPAALPACCWILSPVSLALLVVMPVASDTCSTAAHLTRAPAGHVRTHPIWHACRPLFLPVILNNLHHDSSAFTLPQALACHSSNPGQQDAKMSIKLTCIS